MDTPGNTQPELNNNPVPPPTETPTESVASVVSEVITQDTLSTDPLAEVAAQVPPMTPVGPAITEPLPIVQPSSQTEKTIPTFVPHPAHSALRAIIMTCTFLIVVVGGWYAWTHQEKVKTILDDIITEYMSPTQPIPEVVVSGEVSGEVTVSEEKPFDFSTAPKFDTTQLVTTD